MAQPGNLFAVLLFLAAVFCADVAIFARWIHRANGMDLLSFALATLNILGLVLLFRAILFSARVLRYRRTASSGSWEVDTSTD